MYWFTGDQHFNHNNIIEYCGRPFWTWRDMNEVIIRKHNERVKPGHTVFHIGDFRMTSVGPNVHELMKMLNGNHVFIKGNHDKNNGLNTPLKYCIIETYGKRIVLVHKPEDCNFIMGLLGIDLGFCGHVHAIWQFKKVEYGDLINIGVDVWNYYPINMKQALKAYRNWKMGRIENNP